MVNSFLEKDIEDSIYADSIYFGDIHLRPLKRQYVLPSGRIIDMIYERLDDDFKRTNEIYIIELKAGVIDGKAVIQLLRYMEEIKEIANLETKGILIGKSIEDFTAIAINQISNVLFMKHNAFIETDLEEENWSINVDLRTEENRNKILKDLEVD